MHGYASNPAILLEDFLHISLHYLERVQVPNKNPESVKWRSPSRNLCFRSSTHSPKKLIFTDFTRKKIVWQKVDLLLTAWGSWLLVWFPTLNQNKQSNNQTIWFPTLLTFILTSPSFSSPPAQASLSSSSLLQRPGLLLSCVFAGAPSLTFNMVFPQLLDAHNIFTVSLYLSWKHQSFYISGLPGLAILKVWLSYPF